MLKIMISFDIIAGRTKRAPAWMQKSGLEWCYRIHQEPGRMWKRYAKTNPVFVWMVVKEYVKRRAPQLNESKTGFNGASKAHRP
jgi:N-acetylglucosaminyldiphosphoundecaprenol N-acetyl-beta-D-mannosaminyltransferase